MNLKDELLKQQNINLIEDEKNKKNKLNEKNIEKQNLIIQKKKKPKN